mgnify:CR=1 FL=1
MEDYELWLRLMQTNLTFSNIGQVLLKYRKHETNTSKSVGNEAEIELKLKHFNHMGFEVTPELVSEFIMITNRNLKEGVYHKVMSNLKHR